MTTIEDLPDCVLEQLLRHPALHHRDVRAAGQTCRRLRALCGPIWRRGRAAEIRRTWDEVSAVKRSIGSTIGFHNHGEGPY